MAKASSVFVCRRNSMCDLFICQPDSSYHHRAEDTKRKVQNTWLIAVESDVLNFPLDVPGSPNYMITHVEDKEQEKRQKDERGGRGGAAARLLPVNSLATLWGCGAVCVLM